MLEKELCTLLVRFYQEITLNNLILDLDIQSMTYRKIIHEICIIIRYYRVEETYGNDLLKCYRQF